MPSACMSFQAFAWNLRPQIDEQYTADQAKAKPRGPIRHAGCGNEDP